MNKDKDSIEKSRPFTVTIIREESRGQNKLDPQFSYARGNLGAAVWKLATGKNGIKARLADAFIEIAILQESDFPPELCSYWRQIRSDLTSGKMQYNKVVRGGELVEVPVGRLYSTLRFMRLKKAQRIAEQICDLEARLNSYSEEH